jgi:plasmid stability protein
MLDADLADAIKLVASRYGMSLASYMRSLVRSALEAEARGIYAPAAISRYVIIRLLGRLGIVPIPLSLLSASSARDAKQAGSKLGSTIRGLDIDAEELLLLLTEELPGAVLERNRILLLGAGEEWEDTVKQFIAGLAEALGFKVTVTGRALVIELAQG